jgi:hypothetical protein
MKKIWSFLFVISAAVIAVAGGASSASLGEPPGVSAGVAALGSGGVAQTLPGDVSAWVNHAGSASGTDPAAARANVHLLRSSLGGSKVDLYAFQSKSGATCFLLRTELGLCPVSPSAGDPGIQWAVSGGGPAGQLPALVGIVGDNVTAVNLIVGSVIRPLGILNNSVFAELPELVSNPNATVNLQVSYADSGVRTVSVAG